MPPLIDETKPLLTTPPKKPNWLKRMYAWVLHWADTKYGLPALVIISFVESSFFPIPPDVLLIALCMGAPKRGLKFAAWCSVASVAGGALGYYIGYAFYEEVGRRIIDALRYQAAFDKVAILYGDNAFISILTAAFTPIPYKVFTIAAGVFHEQVSIWTLVGASAIGRSGRFFLVAGSIFFFGPPVKKLIDRYLELFTVVFMVLLIGSFVLIKYLL